MGKIGIAGVGGIGSNVAMLLARAGLDNFKIADFDKIDKTNLNRQFYFYNQIGRQKTTALGKNLKKINAKIKIEKYNTKLDSNNISSIFSDCDVIVEGFDKALDKSMIIDTYAGTGKLIVSACGVAGINVDNIVTKKIQKNIFIVGDFESDVNSNKLYSSKVMIVASIMANIILKYIFKN